MAFFQDPPQLGNQYDDDALLREYLERKLPPEALSEIEPILRELGELAGGHLYALQTADRLNEPVLTHFDPWGNRIDQIEVTPLWKEAQVLAARYGLVATAYERKHG
ncbi:MAG TPA: acyl-CoA dehydrogenase, partial [Polyangia bacterium]